MSQDSSTAVAAERARCEELLALAVASGGTAKMLHDASLAIRRGDDRATFRAHLCAVHGVSPKHL